MIVHLVPHTHDDVGWLKTVDEYFSGAKYNIQKAGVELVIETVMRELIADPNKRFSYVEMKFFSMWWKYQTEGLKNEVRKLVKEERLEFLNAGWSMHDEACPHFEDMINNMLHGHQFLSREFGVKPRVGWHIDPFGHSSANPRLFADMGFDAWIFSRLDHQDKEKRLANNELEFIWRPFFDHNGKQNQIFTHTMYGHYSAPKGFNFDTTSGDDPIEDNPKLETYNVDDKIVAFRALMDDRRQHYRNSKNLFCVMGDDFQYANAKQNFMGMDKLIKHFNAKYTDMQLQYSTPSIYLRAIAAENPDAKWPTKYDDMMPYSDKDEAFWTGYFTSRANAKDYVRRASHNLFASNKLYGLEVIAQDKNTPDHVQEILTVKNKMMDAMGIL